MNLKRDLRMPDTNKCIFCGKETEYMEKFPHGEFPLCPSEDCRNRIVLQVSYDNFPAIWVGRDDLYNEDSGYERMPQEEYDALKSEEIIRIAKDTAEALGEFFWQSYDEAVKEAVQWRRDRIELKKIEETPDDELPLLMGHIKSKENLKVFENRLRGIKEKEQ